MKFDVPGIYKELRKTEGYSPAERLGWTTAEMQRQNFVVASRMLKDVGVVLPGLTMHDAGCGVGDLLPYLQEQQLEPRQYIGTDFTLASIEEACVRFPGRDFRCLSILEGEWPRTDVTLAMGTLAFHPPRIIEQMLNNLWDTTSCAMAFNTWWTLNPDYVYFEHIEQLRKCVSRFLRGKQSQRTLGTEYGCPTEALFVVYR